jgi:hypothetical protein
MIFDKENKFAFTIKIRRSEISIPIELFLGIIGGIFAIGFLKAARSL